MAEEDLIFGKNRHFFGGIEPSNMKELRVEYSFMTDAENVTITAKLPDNTVIDGQTLCTVAGAIIRRKKDSAPTSEFDGEFVADIDSDKVIKNSVIGHEDETMVYAAFPYTTQGVYNRNPANTCSVNLKYSEPVEPLGSFTYNALTYVDGHFEADLKFTHPGNKYTNGRLTAQLAGVMIRVRHDAYPTNENDGDLVVNYTEGLPKSTSGSLSATHHLVNLEQNQKYYYAAFPYNTDNTYTSDASARTMIDVPVAKAPDNVSYFKLTPAFILEQPVIVVDMDVPVADDGSTVSVPIVRKAGSVPANKSDGTLITTFYTNTPKCYNGAGNDTSGHCRFIDEVDGGQTYYYRAFPTSNSGVENNDTTNSKSAYVGNSWQFGFTMNLSSSSPSNITYTDDCSLFTPAKMNLNSQEFEWGSWDFIPGTYFMPRPCILKPNGTVACYLNPHNYAEDEYGNPVNIDSTCEGDVMMEFPKTYWVTTQGSSNTQLKFVIGNKSSSGSYFSPFYSAGGNWGLQSKHFYYSAYLASEHTATSSTAKILKSVSGVYPKRYGTSDTYDKIILQASLKSDTGTADSRRCSSLAIEYNYIATLLTLMIRNTDAQSTIGKGVVNLEPTRSGLLNNKGLFWGRFQDDPSYQVKVFGIEDFWGGTPILGALAFLAYTTQTKTYTSTTITSTRYLDIVFSRITSDTFSSPFNSSNITAYKWGYIQGSGLKNSLSQWSGQNQNPVSTSQIGNGYGALKTFNPTGSTVNGQDPGTASGIGLYYGLNKNYDGNCTGSETTYSCDYINVANYPSTTLISSFETTNEGQWGNTIIPVVVGGGESTITTHGKRGPFYRSYQTSMSGVGTRISYGSSN